MPDVVKILDEFVKSGFNGNFLNNFSCICSKFCQFLRRFQKIIYFEWRRKERNDRKREREREIHKKGDAAKF